VRGIPAGLNKLSNLKTIKKEGASYD